MAGKLHAWSARIEVEPERQMLADQLAQLNSPVVEDSIFTSREGVLDELKVQECMTPDPKCVTPDTPLRQVAEMLALNKFGAMPVVENDRLVGIISYIDFLKHYAAA